MDNLSDGILRQRRNLIVISVLMPLFFLSGASVEQISFLGTEIKIANNSYIEYFIIGLFAYFFWRYWQYFYDDKDIDSLVDKIMADRVKSEAGFFLALIKSKIDKPFEDSVNIIPYFENYIYIKCKIPKVKNTAPKIKKDKPYSKFSRTRVMHLRIHDNLNKYIDLEGLVLRQMPDKETRSTNATNECGCAISDDRNSPLYEIDVTYNVCKLLSYRLLWRLKLFFSKRYYSDYILPFVIAGISFVITLSK